MRIQHFLVGGLSLAFFSLLVSASPLGNSTEPDITATASFPESNPFGHVVNGERNQIFLNIENKSDRNVTITSIAGSFHHSDTNALIKNTTSLPSSFAVVRGTAVKIPYTFHSEFTPGDIKLNIWFDYVANKETHRVLAYESIVTIVEPDISILDFKLVITYLIVAVLFGGLVYVAYLTMFPQVTKKTRKHRAAPTSSEPVAVSASGYQEEWIPEHHLKKGKRKGTTLTSGDELSGGETSGTDGRKRKGKK